jgi:uncharacterized protein (DUF427 family)
MGLTVGDDPFGPKPSGQFDFGPPAEVVYTRPLGRRVRGVVGGSVRIDTDDAHLVWRTGSLARYAFPARDVDLESEDEPALPGFVRVPWDGVDAWYEEDERVFVHPRDPFHRVDVFRTSRRARVEAAGTVIADSARTKALYETGLPVRHYFPSADVRLDLLEPSPTVTECPYKGTATHLRMTIDGDDVDVAWTYTSELRREGEPVRDLVAFYDDRVEVVVS